MKTFKYIGTSLSILIIIFLIFAFLQSREVSISRSIVIDADIETVFDQFNDLEKRTKWSPWEAADSSMTIKMGAITKGVGASYSWESNENGPGSITYVEVVDNQMIQSDVAFGKDPDNVSTGLMFFRPVEDGIMVTWEIHMDLGNNPIMRIMGRYMDEWVGPTFDNGLASVKSISESIEPITPTIPTMSGDSISMDSVQVDTLFID